MNRYQKKMETPQSVLVSAWTGPIELSVKNEAVMEILGTCVAEVYLKKIREELGAAYSTSANGQVTRGADDKTYYVLQTGFPLKPEMTDTCLQIVQAVVEDIAAKGAAEESITKAKEYMLKTFTQNQRENGYWMNRISTILYRNYDSSKDYEAVINGITSADIQQMAKTILSNGNRVRVVMEPETTNE
jgi:zinc protease